MLNSGDFVDADRSPSEIALVRRFEQAYRRPGARYLGATCVLAGCAFLGYYLLDVAHRGMPWFGGVQNFRLGLAALAGLVAVFALARLDLAARYYAPLFGTLVLLFVSGACFASYWI